MKDRRCARYLRVLKGWPALLIFSIVLGGCQAQEPPLSQGAATFKQEVRECLVRLSGGLADPVAKGDQAATNEAIKKIEPDAVKLCRMCPFRIAVLNRQGDTLTIYPFKQDAMGNYSNYEAVTRTLKTRKISQQRLYLQDGAKIFAVCAPLLKGEELLGILVLSLDSQEAQKRWGITQKEFLALDLNK